MIGADFLQLSPAAAPVRGLTGWLADAIRVAIMDGRLRPGTPLPATRLLAGDLGVSRGVIVEAYQRLAAQRLGRSRVVGRDPTARHPAAGRRPWRLSRRDRRGLPAARRRGLGQRAVRGRDPGAGRL